MDLTYISLAISAGVAGMQLLNFLSNKSEKYARAEVVDNEFSDIKDDILSLYDELDEHLKVISNIQVQNGICNNQHINSDENNKKIIKSLEQMLEKIERLQ